VPPRLCNETLYSNLTTEKQRQKGNNFYQISATQFSKGPLRIISKSNYYLLRIGKKDGKNPAEAGQKAHELDAQSNELKAEAMILMGAAKLDDLHIWQMETF